jgi:hypothetical protein
MPNQVDSISHFMKGHVQDWFSRAVLDYRQDRDPSKFGGPKNQSSGWWFRAQITYQDDNIALSKQALFKMWHHACKLAAFEGIAHSAGTW